MARCRPLAAVLVVLPGVVAACGGDGGEVGARWTTRIDTLQEGAGEAGATTYDVLDPDGRYRGTALIPGRLHPYVEPVVRDDRVWAVVLDELDVMHLVAGRLVEQETPERE